MSRKKPAAALVAASKGLEMVDERLEVKKTKKRIRRRMRRLATSLRLLILAVIAWRWWSNRQQRMAPAKETKGPASQAAGMEWPVSTETTESEPQPNAPRPERAVAATHSPADVEADDLEVVEGIGPGISSLLREAGITTYDQLARTDVERLREIIHRAGLNMVDPSSWAEQARLARERDWAGLEELKSHLRAGRRN